MWPNVFPQIDVAALDDRGQVRLLVEVKARRKADEEQAIAWREQLIARRPELSENALLLVTPDQIFFWSAAVAPSASPTFAAAAASLLAPYLSAVTTGGWVDPVVFESVVYDWLQDVGGGRVSLDAMGENGRALGALLRDASMVRSTRLVS